MSYTNPLHTPVGSINHSSYSSLGSAMPSSSSSSSTRRRVPQTFATKSKPISHPIAFDFVGHPSSGMPLREVHARGPHALQQMMQGASDPVLAHTRLRKINLHISWPGYEHVPWCRAIDIVTAHGPMTRSHLASIIAHYLSEYIEQTQRQSTSNAGWKLGPGGFSLDHITLVSLNNICDDSWYAEVAIDFK